MSPPHFSYMKQKRELVIRGSFRGWQGPTRQVISLVPIMAFLMDWFKIPFLGNQKL